MTGEDIAPVVTIVIPNWNGERWLPGLIASINAQVCKPAEVIVVDNGSFDGSLALLADLIPTATVIELGANKGFAIAANIGIERARTSLVALVNTDVVLSPEWTSRAASALSRDRRAASVQTKMVDLADPSLVYDTGNWLRRDGATEQRGRNRKDNGAWDSPGEVFSACAGAAIYRRDALRAIGGFDERLFTYLEDVDVGLRLQLAGWRCIYEPVVALHAGGGSAEALPEGAVYWVERNTVIIVARYFPFRWVPLVFYRQVAWAFHHARAGTLGAFLRGLAAGLRELPAAFRARRSTRRDSIEAVIGQRPWRGPAAGGHPFSPE